MDISDRDLNGRFLHPNTNNCFIIAIIPFESKTIKNPIKLQVIIFLAWAIFSGLPAAVTNKKAAKTIIKGTKTIETVKIKSISLSIISSKVVD